MALNPILQQYISDKSIPLANRQHLSSELDSGALDEGKAASMITAKYGTKYGSAGGAMIASGLQSLGINNGGDLAKGIMNVATAPMQLGKAVKQVDEANYKASPLGKYDNINQIPTQDIQKYGQTPAAQQEVQQRQQQQVNQNLNDIGSMINPLTMGTRAINAAGNTAIEAGKGVMDTVKGIGEIPAGLVTDAYKMATNQPTEGNAAVRGLTDAATGVGRVIGAPITGAVSQLPQSAQENVGKIMGAPNDALHATIKALRPDLSDDYIQQNVLAPIWGAANVSALKGLVSPQEIKAPTPTSEKPGLINSMQSQVTGLEPSTIQTMKQLPDEFKAASKMGVDEARQAPFATIKNFVDDTALEKLQTGKAYEGFKQGQVNVGNYLQDQLQKAGLTVDETGRIKATPISEVRSAGDIAKIQQFYDMYKDNPAKSGQEFLNMRKDLADLAKYDSTTTNNLTSWAKDTRANLNNKFRDQIPGLAEADTKMSQLHSDLSDVKSLIYDARGDLKPNAISNINNLLNKGKELKVDALKEIIPNFNEFKKQIRIAKALEDVEKASGLKVGNYASNILHAGGGLTSGAVGFAAGGVPGAVVGLVGSFLTHPKVFANLITKYAKAAAMPGKALLAMKTAINKGTGLTTQQSAFIANALKQEAKVQMAKEKSQ